MGIQQINTVLFCVAVAALVAVWDILADVYIGRTATISYLLFVLNKRWPAAGLLVAFAMGCLVGHVFLNWPVPESFFRGWKP